MPQLYKKTYRVGDLSDAARADLPFFMAMGEISNHIVTLRLQLLLCSNGAQVPGPLGQVSWPGALLNIKMIAGLLWEAWLFICDKKNGEAFKRYQDYLAPNALAAKKNIHEYFSNSNNLAKSLRNKSAFHIDRATIDAAQASISNDEIITDYLADIQGQVHFGGGGILTTAQAHALVGGPTVEDSLLSLREDIMPIASAMQEFAEGVAESFLTRHVGLSAEDFERNEIRLDGPDLEKAVMPFFASIEPYLQRQQRAKAKRQRLARLRNQTSTAALAAK